MRENGKETEISNADTHTQEHARAHSIQFDEVNARVRVKENFSENFINNAKSITFLLFSLEYGAYFSLVFPFHSWIAARASIRMWTPVKPISCLSSLPPPQPSPPSMLSHVVNIVHFYILCLVIFRSFTILFAVHSETSGHRIRNILGMGTRTSTHTHTCLINSLVFRFDCIAAQNRY